MGIPADLAPEIVELLEEIEGWTLYSGPLPLARALDDLLDGRLLVVNDGLKQSKLAKQAGKLCLLRSSPWQLPLPDGCLTALIVADVAARLPLDLLEGVSTWRRWLSPNGRLLLVECLRRRLGGVLSRRPTTAPEDLTGAMLNAGFEGIGQRFYASGLVVTQGKRLVLPGEPIQPVRPDGGLAAPGSIA